MDNAKSAQSDNPYVKMIEHYSEKKINKILPASIQKHVNHGVRNLLNNSKGKIRILAPNWDYVFRGYIEKIRHYHHFELVQERDIKKANKLEIVVSPLTKKDRDKELQKIKEFKEFYGKYAEKIKFYEFDPTCFKEPIKELQNKKDMPRFIFIEPVGYYIGISDKKMKKSILKGIVNYGDRGRTKKLIKLFDNLKKKACKPIEC